MIWRNIIRPYLVLLGLALLATSILAAFGIRAPKAGDLTVIDGDTVRMGGKNYRILGLDTPETYQAMCQAEYQAGIAAGQRLQEIINAGAVLLPTGKSCKYGRECAHMMLGDEDVAELMIKEGYAVLYSGRGPRKNWCLSE